MHKLQHNLRKHTLATHKQVKLAWLGNKYTHTHTYTHTLCTDKQVHQQIKTRANTPTHMCNQTQSNSKTLTQVPAHTKGIYTHPLTHSCSRVMYVSMYPTIHSWADNRCSAISFFKFSMSLVGHILTATNASVLTSFAK